MKEAGEAAGRGAGPDAVQQQGLLPLFRPQEEEEATRRVPATSACDLMPSLVRPPQQVRRWRVRGAQHLWPLRRQKGRRLEGTA